MKTRFNPTAVDTFKYPDREVACKDGACEDYCEEVELVFLAIKLLGNSNKILKTDLSRRWVLKKIFENKFFLLEKSFENQLYKQGPTGRANLFTGVFGKLRARYDYYKRDRTRNPRTCCERFWGKQFEKGHEMHSGYLESKTSFRVLKKGNVSWQVWKDMHKGKSLNA